MIHKFRRLIPIIIFISFIFGCSWGFAATSASKISTPAGLKGPVSQISATAFNQWTTNGPYGGEVRSLAVDPKTPTTVYAGAQFGGIFKSTDSAANWRKLDLNLPASSYAIQINTIAVDPVNPSNIYAGLYWYGIIKSTDGGESWSQINTGLSELNVRSIAVDPSDTDILYAATDGGGIFKSGNGGVNWSPINTGLSSLSVKCIAINPTTTTIIYIGTSDGVYKSTNGGENWEQASTGITDTYVLALAIDPVTPAIIYSGTANGGVFKSTDEGAQWSLVKSGSIRTLAIDPTEPSIIYAGINDPDTFANEIFRSTNGGETWDIVYGHDIEMVNAIAIDPLSPVVVYAGVGMMGGGKGVIKSMDRGTTWSQAAKGLMGAYVQNLTVDSDTSKLYAGASSGAFTSLDYGDSWEAMQVGQDEGFIRTISIDPSDSDVLYAASADRGIFKSIDGGASWIEVNAGLTDTMVTSIVIDPVTPETLFVWTPNGGLHKSVDGADHWTPIATTLPTGQFSCLVIDPKTPSTLYFAGLNQGVYKSTDEGVNWNQLTNGLSDDFVSYLAIDPVSPSTLYAATGSGVFKSTDGGASWNPVNAGLTDMLVNTLVIDPVNTATVYAGTFTTGVFKSIDGGANWRALPSAFDGYFSVNAIVVDLNDTKTVYVGTGDIMYNRRYGGVYRLPQAPEIATTPTTLDFANTSINTTGSLILTLENSGFAPLHLGQISITGSDSDMFEVVPGGPKPCDSLTPTIHEGGSCTLVTTITPSCIGALSAVLNISSDTAESPSLQLSLNGTGVLPKHSLTVNISGGGSVNNLNNPPDFTCTEPSCTGSFDQGTELTLRATPESLYKFDGWSDGGCSGTGDCTFALDNDVTVDATFSALPLVRVSGNFSIFFSLQEAYAEASYGCELLARNASFSGGLYLGRQVDITLKGGLESDFSSINGYTYISPYLTLGLGSLVVDNLVIQ